MTSYKVSITGTEPLEKALKAKSIIRFEAVEKKQLTQMLNRARHGGTPIKSHELEHSSEVHDHEMGYTKEYAGHVEFGHRTLDGGFVPGQRYLQKNVEQQGPIYREDLVKEIRNG